MTKTTKANAKKENGVGKPATDPSRALYYLVKYYNDGLKYYPELTGFSNCEMYAKNIDLKPHLMILLEDRNADLKYKGFKFSSRLRLMIRGWHSGC